MSYISEKCLLPEVGSSFVPIGNISSAATPKACALSEITVFLTLIKSGASFFIAITLYLAGSDIKSSEFKPFFSIKNESSSILFLSEEGKETQTLPSSAFQNLSIAIL